MNDPLNQPIHITLFPDVHAVERESLYVSLHTFAERLRDTRAPSKEQLPLFSPCAYGAKRTSKRSLRHDSNIRECFAIVGDYDAGNVSVADATAALQRAGVSAVVYTTPSHTLARPRWRVVCPLSDPLHYARANATGFQLADYHRLVSRLAGIFPDGLAAESWNRSQSWYFGAVADSATHDVVAVHGD
jgi:hypothetical protein